MSESDTGATPNRKTATVDAGGGPQEGKPEPKFLAEGGEPSGPVTTPQERPDGLRRTAKK